MFVRYIIDDLGTGLSEEVIRTRVCSFIFEAWEKGIVRIVLAHAENRHTGFGIFQIDRPESDWCKHPGWGFIREFYVEPAHRLRGLGRALCMHIESRLREMGATRAYLTCDGAIAF
jgi:GNAT superfamily N-acetyltransferase